MTSSLPTRGGLREEWVCGFGCRQRLTRAFPKQAISLHFGWCVSLSEWNAMVIAFLCDTVYGRGGICNVT